MQCPGNIISNNENEVAVVFSFITFVLASKGRPSKSEVEYILCFLAITLHNGFEVFSGDATRLSYIICSSPLVKINEVV